MRHKDALEKEVRKVTKISRNRNPGAENVHSIIYGFEF